MQASGINRLHHLDAVRAIALLLGVVFHACLSFMPIFIGWAVMDINTSNWAAVFALISHSFRLETFFLIAGFFAHLSLHRQTKLQFALSRIYRIAVPFILFWFLVKPLLEAGWLMGANSYFGDFQILSSLSAAYSKLKRLPEGLFVNSHLWFLYYLLIITLGVILARGLLDLNNKWVQKIGEQCDAILNFLVVKKLMLMVLLGPTIGCLWFMQRWGVDTPDRSLVPQVPVLALYLLFFSLGWLLHRVPKLLAPLTCISWKKIGLITFSVVICLKLSPYESQYGHPFYDWLKFAYIMSYAVMMWSFVFLLIGLCERLFSKPNRVVRYLADASYWMYLVHLPIVIFLQVLVADISFFWGLKLLLIVAITVLISLLSYDAFVRASLIGSLLNGTRKPPVLFTFKRLRGDPYETH